MNPNRKLRWLAALVCALSMTPAVGVGQVRDRDRDRRRTSFAPLLNIYTEQQSRTRLGLYLDADQSRRFDRDGALITGVMRDSPAEDAGLQEGDIITVFEGQVLTIPLPDSDVERDLDLDRSLPAQRLIALARELEDGQTVEIRYLRDGGSTTVSVEAEDFEFPRVRTFGSQGLTFGAGPDVRTWALRWGDGGDIAMTERMRELQDRLGDLTVEVPRVPLTPGVFAYGFGVTSTEGVQFMDLNPQLGEYFGTDSGVLVIEVDEDSTLGLLAGDVVLAVGAREAENVGRVLRLIRSYEEDEPVRFRIMRQGSEMVAEGFLD